MRPDIAVGSTFPDYELTDHNKKRRTLSELQGQGTAKGNRITGNFTGGTGRYAGATGTYEFSWQYVLEAEDGTVQGRSAGLKGRVRFDAKPAGSPQGAKP